MKTYQKINTLYNRYMFLDRKVLPEIPNEKWRQFRNLIILGDFVSPEIEALADVKWDATEKVDGTNTKMAYFPASMKFVPEGKSESAESQDGQYPFVEELGKNALEAAKELFPYPSDAKFIPQLGPNKRTMYFFPDEPEVEGKYISEIVQELHMDMPQVKLVEQPIIIYGEYYGGKVQGGKIGGKYGKNDFRVFDILKEGYWLSREDVSLVCEKLGLKQVPFLGQMTIREAEQKVIEGFTSAVSEDKDFLAEGIVMRAPYGICDRYGNRIIVKIKTKDYREYDRVRSQFTDDEFAEFTEWYNNSEQIKELRKSFSEKK